MWPFSKKPPTSEEVLLQTLKRAAANPDAWTNCKDSAQNNRAPILFADIQINDAGYVFRLTDNTWHRVDLDAKQMKRVAAIYNGILAEQAIRNIERKLEGLKQ